MYRPEEYELRPLQLGLGMETPEIVSGMRLLGWKTNASTLSRLRTSSDLNIDVAGLPFFAIQHLFATTSGVAIIAQTGSWINRSALSRQLTGDELDEALSAVEERIDEAESRYAQLKSTNDEEIKAERAIDLGSIAEVKGQLAATRNQHLVALENFMDAYGSFLPVARRAGCHLGGIVGVGRTLAAALNEAFECDEADRRPIGKEPVEMQWRLWRVIQRYRAPSPIQLLTEAVARTGDDRMAANHADGFALAGEPRQAARMIQAGLAHACEGATLETWQPPTRTEPVISEDYMRDAVIEYKRLRVEKSDISTTEASIRKESTMKRLIPALLVVAALFALAVTTNLKQAEAKPSRITSIEIALT